MTVQPFSIDEQALRAFCERWRITELALFGSALRPDFRAESDVDVLVTFAPDAHWSLLDLATMEDELSAIVQRSVDLVSRRGVEQSPNWIIRREILSSAEVIYRA